MSDSILFSLDGREDITKLILSSSNNFLVDKLKIGVLRNQKFSDGELCVDYVDSVRGKKVFLVTSPNTSDEIIKLTLAIDAAKRAGASEIIAVLPYLPYARQDKKDQLRGPIGGKVIAEIIERCGATSIITFDLHADQIQGFFNIPLTHIEGKYVFNDYISKLNEIKGSDIILCSPDAGGGKRVKRMQNQMLKYHNISLNYVMVDKTRTEANVVDDMVIIGDVNGKDVIILDDMIDTGGSLVKAVDVLLEAGAKSVRAIITHGVLSGPALERIGSSKLIELVISDSLQLPDPIKLCLSDFGELKCLNIKSGFAKIKVISVTTQIGLAISAIAENKSYEEFLIKK